jgi:SAM-dependent methyltransferase
MGFYCRTSCPACNCERTTTLLDVPLDAPPVRAYLQGYYKKLDWKLLAGGRYHAQQCGRCGCIFQAHIPDQDVLAEVYGNWLVPDDPREMIRRIPDVERDPSLSKAAHELMALSSQLGVTLDHAHVLDYGFGWGEWLEVAIALGAKTYGTELGMDKRQNGIALGVAVIEDHEISSLQFDLVRAEQVLEHLPDPMGLLRQLGESLKPGGAVYVSVPRDDRLAARLHNPAQWTGSGESSLPLHHYGSAAINALEPLEHLNCFSPKSLSIMADRSGLEYRRLGTLHRYAFLREGLKLTRGGSRRVMKSLVRPVYELARRNNQSCVMIKPK